MRLEKYNFAVILLLQALCAHALAWDEEKISNELQLLKSEAFLPKEKISLDEKKNDGLLKRERFTPKVDQAKVLDLEAKYFNPKNKKTSPPNQTPFTESSDQINTKAAAPLKTSENLKKRNR